MNFRQFARTVLFLCKSSITTKEEEKILVILKNLKNQLKCTPIIKSYSNLCNKCHNSDVIYCINMSTLFLKLNPMLSGTCFQVFTHVFLNK